MENKIVYRYILFYLTYITIFSFLSYGLDYIFYTIDYGSTQGYKGNNFLWYLITLVVNIYFIPLIIIYNMILNMLVVKTTYRYLFAATVGLFVGMILGSSGVGLSIYIGELRWLKHLLIFPLTGLLLELIRQYTVTKRYTNVKSSTQLRL